MKKTKEQKGITLITLIITIVVLLILAVVTINAIKGDGIIQYARNAASDYEKGQNDESSILDYYLSLIDESQSDLIIHGGVIPEGGVYTCADGTVYNAGEKFPETVTNEDTYSFGDYTYTLNYTYTNLSQEFETLEDAREYCKNMLETQNGMSWNDILVNAGLTEEQAWEELGLTEEKFYGFEYGEWSVDVNDTTKTQYGDILGKINNYFVTTMNGTFSGCKSLTISPAIPSSITDMHQTFFWCESLATAPTIPEGVTWLYYTFGGCKSLTTVPTIPEGVTNMEYTFSSCSSLTGEIEINANPTNYDYCFSGTQKDIKIVGSCSEETKAALARTSPNGNITY